MSRPKSPFPTRHFALPLALVTATLAFAPGQAQQMDKYGRDRGLQMLHDVAEGVRKYYFDPSYRGVDFSAKVKMAEQAIQNANNNSQIFGSIAGILAGCGKTEWVT
jgi:hypothetical protein